MIFFEWDKSFESGVETMDHDHKWLVGLINNLYKEMGKGDGKSIINEIIDQLVEYSKYHFRNEERLMAELNYKHFDMHKAQHDAFITKVDLFIKKTKEDSISIDVAKFLKEWMISHIQGSDKRFANYILS